MNGLQLSSMPASDMLDVLHYFLEQDFRYSSEYEPIYKDEFRKNIYKQFYGAEYKYVSQESPQDEIAREDNLEGVDGPEVGDIPEEVVNPFNPRSASVKPYIEPTQVVDGPSPFGDILDIPLN